MSSLHLHVDGRALQGGGPDFLAGASLSGFIISAGVLVVMLCFFAYSCCLCHGASRTTILRAWLSGFVILTGVGLIILCFFAASEPSLLGGASPSGFFISMGVLLGMLCCFAYSCYICTGASKNTILAAGFSGFVILTGVVLIILCFFAASEPSLLGGASPSGFFISMGVLFGMLCFFAYSCYLCKKRAGPAKVMPAKAKPLTEEELALLHRLNEVARRVRSADGGITPLAQWKSELQLSVGEAKAETATAVRTRTLDGEEVTTLDDQEIPFIAREHLKPHLDPILVTLEADLLACARIDAVAALDDVIAFDKDG